jgi:Holliday junction resolvase RusA-like endonuclease
MLLYKCTILSRTPVKKNTMQVVGNGRFKRAIYSKQFRHWEIIAHLAMIKAWDGKRIDCPIEAKFVFYFKNRQGEPDLANLIDSPQDTLTKAGVIIDDKIIQVIHAQKHFGEEPRCEIELYALEI